MAGKARCESLVPLLDQIRVETGRYPGTLASDARLGQRPSLFSNGDLVHYYSDGAMFTCEVSNPAELFGGFLYSSADRRWVEWKD